VVLALSRDKDAAGIVAAIAQSFPRTRLVATRTRSERALGIDALLEVASQAGLAAEGGDDVPSAARRALALAGPGHVLLTGSLFAVGEAMEAFGGAPGEWL
jgi:folylpolyglutamate synthase/dihydropteroate synthase